MSNPNPVANKILLDEVADMPDLLIDVMSAVQPPDGKVSKEIAAMVYSIRALLVKLIADALWKRTLFGSSERAIPDNIMVSLQEAAVRLISEALQMVGIPDATSSVKTPNSDNIGS